MRTLIIAEMQQMIQDELSVETNNSVEEEGAESEQKIIEAINNWGNNKQIKR